MPLILTHLPNFWLIQLWLAWLQLVRTLRLDTAPASPINWPVCSHQTTLATNNFLLTTPMHVPHTAMPALTVMPSISTFSARLPSFLMTLVPTRTALLPSPARCMAVLWMLHRLPTLVNIARTSWLSFRVPTAITSTPPLHRSQLSKVLMLWMLSPTAPISTLARSTSPLTM